uniref:Uncharacterized protein n=1 Tax=mine drainage metagenome TaxID=410659 RepID=E6PG28_9ZZZZ
MLIACNRNSFNPRPAARPGESFDLHEGFDAANDVSIHARPLGRANLRVFRAQILRHFVSIHARPLGRANLDLHIFYAECDDVSIHARPLGRANPFCRRQVWVPRIVSIHARPLGRANRCCFGAANRRYVSIHARPLGRANRWRPAIARAHRQVSIHARPLGRANPRIMRAWDRNENVSIHARPLGRANLYRRPHDRTARPCFNPRPAARPGESGRVRSRWRLSRSFNPRPAARPGESRGFVRFGFRRSVSIHARPLGRANPHAIAHLGKRIEVSIHARPLGRANRAPLRRVAAARLFQSTPGRSAGRIPRSRAASSILRSFNPRPAARPGESSRLL